MLWSVNAFYQVRGGVDQTTAAIALVEAAALYAGINRNGIVNVAPH